MYQKGSFRHALKTWHEKGGDAADALFASEGA